MKARYRPCLSVKLGPGGDIRRLVAQSMLPTREAWMNIRYRVELSEAERSELQTMLSGGKHSARNLKRALSEEPRPGAARKLSGQEEALLVATACSSPPAGRARWTLELLAGEM